MKNRITRFAIAGCSALALVSCADMMGSSSGPVSFFITSAGSGNGADLGGLAGADKHCQSLAQSAGAGGKTWRAYLSTQGKDGAPTVNARDRIGSGPWYNAKGERIARNVAPRAPWSWVTTTARGRATTRGRPRGIRRTSRGAGAAIRRWSARAGMGWSTASRRTRRVMTDD